MSYTLKLAYSRYGWGVVAGIWRVAREVKVVYSVYDGAPVIVTEPVAVVDTESLEKLTQVMWLLEQYSSYATTLSLVKYALGDEKKRVFVTSEAIGVITEDDIKACSAGGLDGVVPYPYKPQVERGVPVVNLDIESAPGYVYLELEELARLKNVQGKIAGVIVEFPGKVTPDCLMHVREFVHRHVGRTELLVAVNHVVVTLELIRKIRDLVSGVVLTSLGKVLKLKIVQRSREEFLYRCDNCMIDIVSDVPLRKCPYCQNKLSELLSEIDERALSRSARELKFVNIEFMSRFNPARARLEFR